MGNQNPNQNENLYLCSYCHPWTFPCYRLKTMNKSAIETDLHDGPTNGTMTDEEKDTLIQVLCPGNVSTSFTQTNGKSSTCNNGASKPVATSAVETNEEVGET